MPQSGLVKVGRASRAQKIGYCRTQPGERDGGDRADGAGPAQLVLPEGTEIFLLDGDDGQGFGDADGETELADFLAEQVVVGELVDQDFEAADAFEVVAIEGHGTTEAILAAEGGADQCAGQETMREMGGADGGREAGGGGFCGGQSGDEAGARALQLGDDFLEVVGADVEIAIGDDEHVVFGVRQHVDQIGDLGVHAAAGGIDDDPDIGFGVPEGDAAGGGQSGIGGILCADDELNVRVVLPAEGGDGLLEQGFVAANGFENSDRRQPGQLRGFACGEGKHGQQAKHTLGNAEPDDECQRVTENIQFGTAFRRLHGETEATV